MHSPEKLRNIVSRVSKIATSNGIGNSYVVGGYPRSLIMDNVKEDVHDLDFASVWPGEATKLGSMAASEMINDLPEIYHRTGTIKFTYDDVDLEFQGTLANIFDYQDAAIEMESLGIEVSPLTLNIYSRDFTINTLIQDLSDLKIYDITGYGYRDIKNKVIRTNLSAERVIKSNPLIIMRAIRFSFRYGFKIDRNLQNNMMNKGRFIEESLESERLQIEVLKMMQCNYDETIRMFKKFGLSNLLYNDSYNIFEVIKDVDIENFQGDIKDLIGDKNVIQ